MSDVTYCESRFAARFRGGAPRSGARVGCRRRGAPGGGRARDPRGALTELRWCRSDAPSAPLFLAPCLRRPQASQESRHGLPGTPAAGCRAPRGLPGERAGWYAGGCLATRAPGSPGNLGGRRGKPAAGCRGIAGGANVLPFSSQKPSRRGQGRVPEVQLATAPTELEIFWVPVQGAVPSCPWGARGAPRLLRCPVRGAVHPYVGDGFGFSALVWVQKGASLAVRGGPGFRTAFLRAVPNAAASVLCWHRARRSG